MNIGVAIALPVNQAGGAAGWWSRRSRRRPLGLRQISSQTKRLSEGPHQGLSIEEMSDSTFTISNLGMFGVGTSPRSSPPNAAILAVGATVEKPVVAADARGEKKLVIGEDQMTMSSDHRVIDGAMAAQYLQTVKHVLETPATLLV